MAKHGKNTTANPIYTNYERRRDAKESGFGTQKLRLDKYSTRRLDQCALTNQKCTNPVISKDGYIFEKEAILEYILKQKNTHVEKMRIYRKQLAKYEKIKNDESLQHEMNKKEKFIKANETIKSSATNKSDLSDGQRINNMSGNNEHNNPAFWLQSKGVEEGVDRKKPIRPVKSVVCPITKKPLKISDLYDVKFNYSADGTTHLCPISGDLITNATTCAVLKTTGNIIKMDYVDKFIKKLGDSYMVCPLSGEKLDPTDIIPVKIGGSAFSASNTKLIAKISKPVLQSS